MKLQKCNPFQLFCLLDLIFWKLLPSCFPNINHPNIPPRRHRHASNHPRTPTRALPSASSRTRNGWSAPPLLLLRFHTTVRTDGGGSPPLPPTTPNRLATWVWNTNERRRRRLLASLLLHHHYQPATKELLASVCFSQPAAAFTDKPPRPIFFPSFVSFFPSVCCCEDRSDTCCVVVQWIDLQSAGKATPPPPPGASTGNNARGRKGEGLKNKFRFALARSESKQLCFKWCDCCCVCDWGNFLGTPLGAFCFIVLAVIQR